MPLKIAADHLARSRAGLRSRAASARLRRARRRRARRSRRPSSRAARSSSVLVLRSRRSRASARIAASARRACRVLASWTVACVERQQRLDLGVLLLGERALAIAGSISSSAPLCSSFAAASRTARSGDGELAARRSRVASSRRTRLLTTTSSRDSGSGATACAGERRRSPASPLTLQHALVAGGLHLAVEQRLQQRQRRRVAAAPTSAPIALTLRVALAERQIADEFGRDRQRGLARTRPARETAISARRRTGRKAHRLASGASRTNRRQRVITGRCRR